jgi:AcrR family transcriptional regulator
MTFVRARQPEQKEERRAHLLATARALLDGGTPLQDLSLNELARQAAMTKSNVYRYFESREAVLIELLRDEWFAWFATLTSTWTSPPPPMQPLRHLIGHIAHTLAARPTLCLLTSVLPSVLEQNLSDQAITDFKRMTLGFFGEVAAFISSIVPGMPHDVAMVLMHDGAIVLTGLYPHTHPAMAVERALQATPELRVFTRDLEADLGRFLYAIAVDLMEQDRQAPNQAPWRVRSTET